MAQTITKENLDTLAANNNTTWEETDPAIDAALQASLQADILAEANAARAAAGQGAAATIDDLSDEELAQVVGAVLTNNPTLTTNQVTAVVRAAARGRTGAGIAVIAGAAAYARPDTAKQVQLAAISVAPDGSEQIITRATVISAVNAVNDSGDEVETNVSDS
ncbi:MAG: hypothetical protein O3B22_16295 [Proteobacteria bacterium]|nr:hypothetical protein [Pseudomonadota bacterium]